MRVGFWYLEATGVWGTNGGVGKQIAETCLNKAKDLSGLLLLYTARGSAKGLESLAPDAEEAGRANIAFLSLFLLGRISECVDLLLASNRVPEVPPCSCPLASCLCSPQPHISPCLWICYNTY